MAATAGVMSPRRVADIFAKLIVRLDALSRRLLDINQAESLEVRGHLTCKLDTTDDRVQILTFIRRPFLEVAEVDLRGIKRVAGTQSYLSCAIVGMRLQNRPCEVVQMLGEFAGIPRIVPIEFPQQGHAKKIGQWPLGGRAVEECQD